MFLLIFGVKCPIGFYNNYFGSLSRACRGVIKVTLAGKSRDKRPRRVFRIFITNPISHIFEIRLSHVTL